MSKTTISRETLRALAQALLKTRRLLETSRDSAETPWWHRDRAPRVRGALMDWLAPHAGHDRDRLMALVEVLIFLMSVNVPWKISEGRLATPEELRFFARHIAQTHYRDEVAVLCCLCLWRFVMTADAAAVRDAAVSDQSLDALLKPVDALSREEETQSAAPPAPAPSQPPPSPVAQPAASSPGGRQNWIWTTGMLGVLLLACLFFMSRQPPASVVPTSGQEQPPVVRPSRQENVPVVPPSGQEGAWTNSIGMEFVLIPAGTFQMGCSASEPEDDCFSNEKPRHTVTISRPFYLGKYEVTQEQWEAVMGNNPSEFEGSNRPVEDVSWEDAQSFIRKLNEKEGHNLYRLPTEAEWEYAARAGSQTAYSFGNDKSQLGNYAWYRDNAGGKTHPVGQKQANAWGLYDMHGNVWEWVQDWRGSYSAGAVVDPQGAGAGGGRVLRGGGWNFDAWSCRSAYRVGGRPALRSSTLGFRLVRLPGH